MEFLKETIINKIIEYPKISLFFHEVPDFDALGACFGLKSFINNKYPDKEVRIIGFDVLDKDFEKNYFEFNSDHVPNEYLSESLGIILDTANELRVWTGRHKYCKELIRIDHHPQVEAFAQFEWVDAKYPATCEMVGELLYEWDANFVYQNTAAYLYAGIVTDTGRFLYLTTNASTFALTAKLLETNFDRSKINDAIYLKTFKESQFSSYVMNKVHMLSRYKFAYAILPKNCYNRFGINLRLSMVHVLNNIKGLEVWMTVYYDNTLKAWRGSIRSKHFPINQLAEKYRGGGHKYAAGFTLRKLNEFKHLRNDIIKYLHYMLSSIN